LLLERLKEVTGPNTLVMIKHAKVLYETYKEATEIFKLIAEVDEAFKPKSLVWRILQDDSREALADNRKLLL